MSKKVIFRVSTSYVGSEVKEEFTLEELGIDEHLSEDEMEKALFEVYQDWLWENVDISYGIEEE